MKKPYILFLSFWVGQLPASGPAAAETFSEVEIE